MGGRRGARPPLGSPAPSRAGLEGGKEETPHTPRQTDGQNRHPAQPPGRLPLTCCADAGSGLRRVTHVVQSFLTGLGRVGWGTFILPAPPPPSRFCSLFPLPIPAPSRSSGYTSPLTCRFSVALTLGQGGLVRPALPSSFALLHLFGGAPEERQSVSCLSVSCLAGRGRNSHETEVEIWQYPVINRRAAGPVIVSCSKP